MTWGSPLWLYALVIPGLMLLRILFFRTRHYTSASMPKANRARIDLAGARAITHSQAYPRKLFLCLGLALLVTALARPRWGSESREVIQRSREVIIALDLSKSMLAEDLKPNRLERAKLSVGSLLDTLQGESVGLIVFAGSAFLQSPMSPDYQILRGFLKDIDPSYVPQGGTNYSAMIDTALESFSQSDGLADRFLIVISDGESQGDEWKGKSDALVKQNVKTICLGFGTAQGGLIPDGDGGYHKDAQGAVVLTKLEPSTLQSLARETNGLYREANVWIDLAALIEDTVKRGKAADISSKSETFEIERFQYFLGPALFFLFVSLYREFPTSPRSRIVKGYEPESGKNQNAHA